MSHQQYPEYPSLSSISASVKETAKKAKLSNLILCYLDYHTNDADFAAMQATNFKDTNILEVVHDLKHYGYDVEVPKNMAEFRENVYPSFIDIHARAGYHGLQVPVGSAPFKENGDLTEEAVKNLKKQKEIFEKAGLSFSAVGGCFTADWTQSIKPQIAAANILGSDCLYGPFATVFMYFPEGVNSGDESVAWTKAHCKEFSKLMDEEIGPYAESKGVYLCDEPLQRFERMPIRLKEAVEMALSTKSDRLKIMIDMCHEFCDGEGPELYEKLVKQLIDANRLQGLHISAVHRGKLYESWYTKEYFKSFFKPVFDGGYDGEIAIETFDAVLPVREAVKINREKFSNPIGVLINNLVYSATMLEGLK
jgi:sugar phosphate isomerase/epimerase